MLNAKRTNYQIFGKLHPMVKEIFGNVPDSSEILQDRGGNLDWDTKKVPKKKGKIECRGYKQKLNNNLLLPNGDITLCGNDYSLNYIFGNLLESSYEDLYKSKRHRDFVKAMNDDKMTLLCRDCEYGVEVNKLSEIIKTRWKYGNKPKEAIYNIYERLKKKRRIKR